MDDNPRALYEYLISVQFNKKHKMIWVVTDPVLCKSMHKRNNVVFCTRHKPTLLQNLQLEYYLSTSKYLIFSHPYWFSKRRKEQIILHTGHGIGVKGTLENEGLADDVYDFLLCPTSASRFLTEKGWGSSPAKTLIREYPRIDFLFTGDKNAIMARLISNYRQGDRIILAMPTYNRSALRVDSHLNPEFFLSFITSPQDLDEINSFLASAGVHLIMKVHPLQVISNLRELNLSNIHCFTNKELFKKNIILYQLVGVSDALVTDLSSIGSDYLILDRPIGFLKQEIFSYDRGYLVPNIEDFMPGQLLESKEDFHLFVSNLIKGEDDYKVARKNLLAFYHDNYKKNNSKSVIDWLLHLHD